MLPTLLLILAAPPVTAVTYSPDGKTLAAGFRGEVRLIAADTGLTQFTWPGQDGRVTALAFAPDGTLAAASGKPSQSGVVRLYPTPAGDSPVTLQAHKDVVYAMAFSPDGKLLATAGYDRTIKLWATPVAADATPDATLTDHSDAVFALAFSPDGKLLATAGSDRTVKVWDVAGRKRLFTLGDPTDCVNTVAWHPDGQTLFAAGSDRSLRAWAVTPAGGTLKSSVFAHEGPVTRLLAGRDGKTLVTVGEDRRVKVWDAATLRETKVFAPQADVIPAAALSPDGTQLALGLFTGTVLRLDIKTDEPAKVEKDAARFPLAPAGDTSLTLPASARGVLDRAGAVRRLRFRGDAGQEVGVELVTKLDGVKFSPVLTVSDAAGNRLAERDGATLGVKLPAAGVYTLAVRDREFRGGSVHAYTLNLGPVPVVTGVFPLGVTRGVATQVTVRGVHLGGIAEKPVVVTADGAIGSRHTLTLPEAFGPVHVAVGEFPSAAINGEGMKLPGVPYTIDGVLTGRGAAQTVAFSAHKGQRLVIEVEADRLGSPLDSVLEILDAPGRPVPQATLRATATVYTTFRDNTSGAPGIRLEAWAELGVNDYLYVDGELMRIAALPKGPDDDCQFVAVGGKRRGHLGTTPVAHANGSRAYKVERHPPGVAFPPNGLPVFTLDFRNDDGGDGFGRDSVVLFDPPADGTYQARVRDARGDGGPDFAYRLTVREPRPDFRLRVSTPRTVWAGGAVPATVVATRLDGFDGPIRLAPRDLPAGFSIPPTTIEAGQVEAVVTVSAAADAKAAPAGWAVVGTADTGGTPLSREAVGAMLEVAAGTDLTPSAAREVTLRPGGEARFTVRVARAAGFDGRVPFEVRGLPHGVIVKDIGLNGILVVPGQAEREVVLSAAPWVAAQERPVTIVAKSERSGGSAAKGTDYATPPLLLKVVK